MKARNLLFAALFCVVHGGCAPEDIGSMDLSSVQNSHLNSDKVIYGEDNRRDLYQVQDIELLLLAESTVALVSVDDAEDDPTNRRTKIRGKQFGPAYNLCESEPFSDQIMGAFCSGSLIGEDLILTAGHCLRSQTTCEETKFVFGFGLKDKDAEYDSIPSEDVYGCAELIHSEMSSGGSDFAIVRLDRKVRNRQPLAINRGQGARAGDPILVIGHPTGLPTKVTDGARVRTTEPAGYFVTNLDTYGGNSGSAVFNAVTHEIEGILVRGDRDFNNNGRCVESNRCPDDGCRGEDVTKVSEILAHLPNDGEEPENPEEPEAPEEEGVIFENDTATEIPDADTAGITLSIDVDQALEGKQVLVAVDIRHTWSGDLVVDLIAPNGDRYKLANRRGGREDDLRGIFGDDLKPLQDLSELSEATKAGTWKLEIKDMSPRDQGRVESWALIFR